MSLVSLPLILRLSSTVIRVLGCNPGPMTLQGTNTYLVGTGRSRVLIDAGDADTSKEYVSLLGQVLKEENASIEHLILTHWHHDHIGGVNSVQSMLKSTRSSVNPAVVWKLPRDPKDQDISEAEKSTSWQALKDEQVIEVEGAKLQVKHTPGHTTDHACLLLEKENVLFSGDCILGQGTAVFEDLHDYMLSLKKILEMKPGVIYPGHGPVVENPVDSIQFYIKHRQKREDQILQILQEHGTERSMSEMDIVGRIYKDTSKELWPVAAVNVGHHLRKLLHEGRVREREGKFCYVASQ